MKAVATGSSPDATVKTLSLFRKEGLLTIAGVSNVSHGLPHREGINAAFLAMLASHGLDAGIVNVTSPFTEHITAGAGVLSGRVDPADIPVPPGEQENGEDALPSFATPSQAATPQVRSRLHPHCWRRVPTPGK